MSARLPAGTPSSSQPNVPLPPGLVYRSEPALEQWLALGRGFEKHPLGCPLAEWLELAKGAQPPFQDRSLRELLAAADMSYRIAKFLKVNGFKNLQEALESKRTDIDTSMLPKSDGQHRR